MADQPRRLKILIVTAGRVLTPATGGELRTHHLARELAARGHAVDAVGFVARNHPNGFAQLNERLTLRQRHSLWLDLASVADRLKALPITELPLWLAPLRGWLRRAVARAGYDVVQFDFPWFLSLYGAAGSARVVYSAHNVESTWWASRLAAYPFAETFTQRLLRLEIAAAARAAAVAACSAADLGWLQSRVGGAPVRFGLVPNGYDASRFQPLAPKARRRLRHQFGFQPHEKIALFCGSNTHPNREAAAAILDSIAPACADPAVRFVIIGRVGEMLSAPASGRVLITGAADDVVPWMQAADVALNPMLSGSGSNIKVAEYCGAGLPLVTTPFGLRGFESLAPWVSVQGISNFPQAIAAARWPGAIPGPEIEAYSWAAAARALEALYFAALQ